MQVVGVSGLLFTTFVMIGCTGCAATGPRTDVGERIRVVLDRQTAAWNRGDIEAFMGPYWHSTELTFSSGGRVTRGWTETLEDYHRRYPSRDAMGELAFSDLEITPLGDRAALVLGRWRIDRGEPISGAFSLVMRRRGADWIIIHDHTSRDQPK